MTQDFGDVFEKIEELLNSNGSVTQPTRDKLLLMAVSTIHIEVTRLREDLIKAVGRQVLDQKSSVTYQSKSDKRMDVLERNSIIRWIDGHPKTAIFLVVLFFALIYSDFIKVILSLLGFDI
jgi:hypothetical protein